MVLTVHLLFLLFATIVVLCVFIFVVVDMFGRVDYIKSKAPFLDEVLKRRAALTVLLLVTIFLLVGDGYELMTKEMPEVPNPPVLKLVPPAPPAITVVELAPPMKARCWVKNYAVPALPAPPWGIATVFCNTTIKPPYSVELDYDQTVVVGPFTFPVGSEFIKSTEFNQGTKVVSMFDLHTIIPNEPFSIMAQGSHDSNDKFPLVKTVTIRAKGLVFEFRP
jgi:hypothetical protein